MGQRLLCEVIVSDEEETCICTIFSARWLVKTSFKERTVFAMLTCPKTYRWTAAGRPCFTQRNGLGGKQQSPVRNWREQYNRFVKNMFQKVNNSEWLHSQQWVHSHELGKNCLDWESGWWWFGAEQQKPCRKRTSHPVVIRWKFRSRPCCPEQLPYRNTGWSSPVWVPTPGRQASTWRSESAGLL